MDFDISAYQASLGTHHEKDVIWISFPNDRNLIDHLLFRSTPTADKTGF